MSNARVVKGAQNSIWCFNVFLLLLLPFRAYLLLWFTIQQLKGNWSSTSPCTLKWGIKRRTANEIKGTQALIYHALLHLHFRSQFLKLKFIFKLNTHHRCCYNQISFKFQFNRRFNLFRLVLAASAAFKPKPKTDSTAFIPNK
jgi:hypothetical protein